MMELFSIAFNTSIEDTENEDGVSALSSLHTASSINRFAGAKKTFVKAQRSQLKGREGYTNKLLEIFKRVATTGSSQNILIEGPTGTGKTSLAESMRLEVALSGGFFVCGKFDPQSTIQCPYSAIVAAFDEICDLVLESDLQRHSAGDTDDFESTKSPTQRAFSFVKLAKENLEVSMREFDLLEFSRVVSGVSHITGTHAPLEASIHRDEFATGHAFVRFQQQCIAFLRSIASATHPIVIFFDDLQYGDEASITVIRNLMQSVLLRHVLIICAFRDEEEGPHKMVSHASEEGIPTTRQTTRMRLENLNTFLVNELLSELLELDPHETASLSKICFAKTLGNPFFLVQYIRLLEVQNLLEFSTNDRWEWDEEAIQAETDVLGNLVEVVTERAKIADKNVQYILKYAAMLGFTFNIDDLHAILDQCHKEKLKDVIIASIKDGLIEPGREKMYKFSHERVLQSFESLIPDADRAMIHFQNGKRIRLSGLPMNSRRLGLLTNQCNLGSLHIKKPEDKLQLANLNFIAGKTSMQQSAFKCGQKHFETGIQLLPVELWSEHHELALKLHSAATEAAYLNGDAKMVLEMSDVICMNVEAIDDKFNAVFTRISMLSTQSRFAESIDDGFRVLREIGVRLPRKPQKYHVVYEMMKVHKLLRGKSDNDILSLPMMEEQMTMVLQILRVIGRCAFFTSCPELFAVVSARMLALSLQHGISTRWTPESLAMYGLLQQAMKRFEASNRYGQLAMKMIRGFGEDHFDAATSFLVSVFINPIKNHYKDSLALLSRASHRGGRFSDALMCAGCEVQIMFFCGYNLEIVDTVARECHQQMVAFNEVSSLEILEPVMQSILNLMGEVEFDPAILLGEIIDHPNDLIEKFEADNNRLGLDNFLRQSLVVAATFGSWIIAEEYLTIIKRNNTRSKMTEPYFGSSFSRFYAGLSYIGLYQIYENRSHLIEFRRLKRAMSKDLKRGCQSLEPFLQFLYAEEISLKGTTQQVQAAYSNAAEAMREAGFRHLEGIAYEHAGDATLRRFNHTVSAKTLYFKAIERYEKWGATPKVEQMNKKLKRLSLTNVKRSSKNMAPPYHREMQSQDAWQMFQ